MLQVIVKNRDRDLMEDENRSCGNGNAGMEWPVTQDFNYFAVFECYIMK